MTAGQRLDGPAEPPAETLAYAASALDDVRRSLDTAQSAASTALAWIRVQQLRAAGSAGGPESPTREGK